MVKNQMQPTNELLEYARIAWDHLITMPCNHTFSTTTFPKIIVEPGFARKHYVAGTTKYSGYDATGAGRVTLFLMGKPFIETRVLCHELIHARGFPHGGFPMGDFNTHDGVETGTPNFMREFGLAQKNITVQIPKFTKDSYHKGFSCTHFGRAHDWEDRGNYWKCGNKQCNSTKTKPRYMRVQYP